MKSLIKSFRFAFRGICFCICNERNMRIHLMVTVYVLILSRFFSLSGTEYAVLIISIVLVLTMEIINTAMEELVNIVAPAFDPLARIAKDTAASAVLVTSVGAVAVAFCIFWKPEGFLAMFEYFSTRPHMIAIGVVFTILALAFIFIGPNTMKNAVRTNRKSDDK